MATSGSSDVNNVDHSLMTCLRDQISKYKADQSKEAQSAAKPPMHTALHALLLHIATNNIPGSTRSAVDDELCAHATSLKWGLLRGLHRCNLARSYLGLPRTMEQTRIFLADITTQKSTDILEVELGSDIDRCDDVGSLRCVREVVTHMMGACRFKKDLGEFDLSKDSKRSCRTAINRAKKVEKALMSAARQQQTKGKEKGKKSASHNAAFIDRDVRLEYQEREAARAQYFDGVVSDAAKPRNR